MSTTNKFLIITIISLTVCLSLIFTGVILLVITREKNNNKSNENIEITKTQESNINESTILEKKESKQVYIYFANPAESTDFETLVKTKRETANDDLYSFAVDELIKGPNDKEKDLGYIPTFILSGESNCGDNNYTIEIHGNVINVKFCKDIYFQQNPGLEGAWAGISLAGERRAYKAIESTLIFNGINKVIVKDKYGACYAYSAGVNQECVE